MAPPQQINGRIQHADTLRAAPPPVAIAPRPPSIPQQRQEIRLHAFEKFCLSRKSSVETQSSISHSSNGDFSKPCSPKDSPTSVPYVSPPLSSRTSASLPAVVSTYDTYNLPPEQIVSQAISSFYKMAATLWYVMTEDEANEIQRSLYYTQFASQRSTPRLVEMCALASVGAQYHLDCPETQAVRRACMRTVKLYLDELLEESELKAMRVNELACLFHITDKRTTAWAYVVAALRIAEHYGLENETQRPSFNAAVPRIPEHEWMQYRKNWRTLRHLESWLAGTLGRFLNRSPHESINLNFLIDSTAKNNPHATKIARNTNIIQCEFTKASIISCELLRAASSSVILNLPSLDQHIQKLDHWLQQLPEFMQLVYMIYHEDDVTVRNNSMLVHLVYLGARVILARRILVEKPSQVVKSTRMGGDQEHIDEGIKAACQVRIIVGMLLENKQLFKRCWLAIHESLSSASLLLYQATQLFLMKKPYHDLVDNARVLQQALDWCSKEDTIARSYHNLLQEFFDEFFNVNGIQGHIAIRRVDVMAHRLREVMRMPFDGPVNALVMGKEAAMVGNDGKWLGLRPIGGVRDTYTSRTPLEYGEVDMM